MDEFMIFSCNHTNKCATIKKVTRIRYLEIIFYQNSRWNLHTQHLLGKLRANNV